MTDEEILSKLGLDDADEETRTESISSIRTIVELRVIGLLADAIDEGKQEEFERLRTADDTDAVWRWLREEVVGVDVSEIYEATLQDYLREFTSSKFMPEA